MTLEVDPSFQPPASEVELSPPDTLDIEAILLRSDLPKSVRNATDAQVFERLMDSREIARVTESQTEDSDQLERLRIRRKALIGCIDSMLVCALIRLPGVSYTIEIDPRTEEIIHWEWQRA